MAEFAVGSVLLGAGAGSNASSSSSYSSTEVLVRFVTKYAEYRVPTEAIAIPVNLNRVGLSHIILHLLGKGDTNNKDEDLEADSNGGSAKNKLTFEFTLSTSQLQFLRERRTQQREHLGGGAPLTSPDEDENDAVLLKPTLLRTTLKKYLTSYGLTTEDSISVEYAPAIRPPKQGGVRSAPDWVSALAVGGVTGGSNNNSRCNGRLIAGLCDGRIIFGTQESILDVASSTAASVSGKGNTNSSSSSSSLGIELSGTTLAAHACAIAGISLWEEGGGGGGSNSISSLLATSGQDSAVRLWSLHDEVVAASTTTASSNSNSGKRATTTTTASSSKPVITTRATQVAELTGLTDACGGVAIDPSGRFVLSGDARGVVGVWKTQGNDRGDGDDEEDDEEEEDGQGPTKKMSGKRSRKTTTPKGHQQPQADITRKPLFLAEGRHSDRISNVAWLSSASFVTASWDHTACIWDCETLVEGGEDESNDDEDEEETDGAAKKASVSLRKSKQKGTATPLTVLRCGKAITGVSASPLGTLIATSHPDHSVRVWDTRGRNNTGKDGLSSGGATGTGTTAAGLRASLLGGKSWMSDVAWCPLSSQYITSTSYDGNSYVWDMRAPATPLFTLASHTDKALCTAWVFDSSSGETSSTSGLGIVTGGADGRIRGNVMEGMM